MRLLGGGGLALGLAGLACAVAPMLMGLDAALTTSSFEPLCWTGIAYLLVLAIRTGSDRALLAAGLVAGLTLEIKYAVLFWMAGLAIGLMLTPERGLLQRPALWLGVALAAILAAPSAIWQLAHGLPFLELGAAAKEKNADIAALPFAANQVMVMNPAFAPLWIAGVVAPFARGSLRDLRFLVIAAVVVVAIVRLGHGKDYYLAPVFPTLFAIGGAAVAPLAAFGPGRVAADIGIVAGMAFSALAAPMALPILPPPVLGAYVQRIGITPQQQERSFRGTALPQAFADQLGWHDFVREVEAVWTRVPASARAATVIKVDNYGEAAALDLYGTGLPPVVSGHNQYFLWGLRGRHPANVLTVERDLVALRPFCRTMTPLGTTWSRHAMASENGKVIVLCEGVTPPLDRLWPQLKLYA